MSLFGSNQNQGIWSTRELLSNNIVLQHQDPTDFFGGYLGQDDHFDPNILSSDDPTTSGNFTKEIYRFLFYLDLASHSNAGQEAAVHGLTRSVLEVTGFDELGTILQTGYDIPFTCNGDNFSVRPDVCLVHWNSMVLLVVQEEKTPNPCEAEARVISQAIATFQHNNRKRMENHLPPLDIMTIPCIVMAGTRPFFYKVPVTQQLSDCVIQSGVIYRNQNRRTLVSRCSLPPRRRACEGMEIPEYRRTALEYYGAFHRLAKDCWKAFLV